MKFFIAAKKCESEDLDGARRGRSEDFEIFPT